MVGVQPYETFTSTTPHSLPDFVGPGLGPGIYVLSLLLSAVLQNKPTVQISGPRVCGDPFPSDSLNTSKSGLSRIKDSWLSQVLFNSHVNLGFHFRMV